MDDSGQISDQAVWGASRRRFADPTGIPRLDLVLDGGIPRGSLVIVVGPPGSGKTTLAHQLAFAAARAGRRIVTFTALSEPSDKLAEHLRTFSFFDEDLLGSAVQFISLQQFIPHGLEKTGQEVVAISREARADLVVLDGFRGVRGADDDMQASRRFLYDVGTNLGVRGTTVVITTEAEPRDAQFFPEATTADIIIGLHYLVEGVRARRALEVVKSRGARLLSGLHGLHLTSRGLVIFPRLEARIAATFNAAQDELDADEAGEELLASGQPAERRGTPGSLAPASPEDEAPLSPEAETGAGLEGRAPFGLPELDVLLGGGLTRESSTVLIGSPGTGKTLLALQWALAGVRAGERTIFVGLRENRAQLLRKADNFSLGMDLRTAIVPGGALILQWWAPVELDPDVVATRLLATIDRTGARRVVVDSIAEVERAVARGGDPGRLNDFLAALQVALRQRDVSALFIKESETLLSPEVAGAAEAIAVLAENVIFLQHVSYAAELRRVLSVVKMRFSAHDTSLREFTIVAPEGVRVLSPAETPHGVLSGIASQNTGQWNADTLERAPSAPPVGKGSPQSGRSAGTAPADRPQGRKTSPLDATASPSPQEPS